MKKISKKQNLSEAEIDEIVTQQAKDNSHWKKTISVKRSKPTSLSVPADLAARAVFLAQLHHEKNLKQWLTRIIRERIEIEETAFTQAKREMMTAS